MSERGPVCDAGDEAKFQRLSANARPLTRTEAAAFDQDLSAARLREDNLSATPEGAEVALRRATFEKWRLIHDWTRRNPYRDNPRASRPDQWRAALEKFRSLRDRELIDWLILQIDVATNLANGVQDMRPRDPGPTWLVALEYVANRKRKALATLHWAEAAEKDGCFTVDSEWHARSAAILGREPTNFERGDGGHEGVPFIVEDGK
jgi:hypothetical protein